MIFSPALYSFALVSILLCFAQSQKEVEDDFCELVYNDEELYDAFDCNVSTQTNVTRTSESALEIYGGTDPDYDVDEGAEFSLHCCFYAQPYCPVIRWYKDGVEITDVSHVAKNIRKGGRWLHGYTRLEGDGGNYTCIATTPYRNETSSHTIKVETRRRCTGNYTVKTSSTGNVVQVKKGSSQVLRWDFVCFGGSFDSVLCRDGNQTLVQNDSYYRTELRRSQKKNDVTLQYFITIPKFTRSENITCRTNAKHSPSATISLVEQAAAAAQRGAEESFFSAKGMWIVIAIAILLCLAIVLLLWYKKKFNRRTLIFYRPNKKETPARYDAFISYSEADGGSFVRSNLKHMLEDECGYTLSLHYREFVPGTTIVDNIIDSIYDSRRIVIVVTQKFLDSEWCKFEVDQGLRRAIEKPNTLVVIMLTEIPLSKLPKSLRAFLSDVTFLLWDDGKRDEMRKKLKAALGPPFTVNNADGPEKGRSECDIAQEIKSTNDCNEEEVNHYSNPSHPQDDRSENDVLAIV